MRTTTVATHDHGEKAGTRPIQMNQLPGPRSIPVLGNLLQLSPEKLHRILAKWSDEFGSIFKFRLGSLPVVVITAPETIEIVLKSRPEKFRRLGRMDEVIRELGIFGVFNAEGDDWKVQRKLVSQALNLHQIKSFFPTLDNISEKLLNRWNELSKGGSPIDIKGELMRYTVDITSRLAFGYQMNTIEKKDDIIQNHLEIIFPAIFRRINAPFPYWRYMKLPADKKLDRSLAAMNKTLQEIIDNARITNDQPQNNNQPTNFLQALLAASDVENPASNQVIIGNVITMLLAGEDTTAHTMAWVFYYMHLNPDVQLKMQKEADQILGTANTLKCYEDASKLHYIEAVAFEAMRLKPVAPMLFLDTLEDVTIQGVEVPKGTAIFVHTHHAATKEHHFTNAEDFIPERWIDGGCPAHKQHNEKAFIPFGVGPRYCPGHNLAMLEIKAVLAMVCRNFTVSMHSKPGSVREIMAFTMMPTDFYITLKKRAPLN